MGTISLQIPQTGQPNSTEDPKVATDLTTIQTVINGNLDDTNLASPNNAVRRLLLQGGMAVTSAHLTGTNFILTADGVGNAAFGGTVASNGSAPLVWLADNGYNGQPTDFQVAGKTAYGRLRVALLTNTVAPAATFGFNLYPVSGVAGASGAVQFTLGAAVNASLTITTPAASTGYATESAQFALPTGTNWYVLGVNSSATPAAGSVTAITVQLYGYSA